mmetsp:Transcript_6207/g.8652  ORF Transcript_6207/g.8652 Transcript_6207/m.8652 type:complete len:421 (-) Transcript_6207:60-1322(-)
MEGTSISEGVGCLAELTPLLTWTFLAPALVGYIPFVITTTAPEILHLSSVLGSGLLVGTVMETIIPEAYNMLLLDHHKEQEESNIKHLNGLSAGRSPNSAASDKDRGGEEALSPSASSHHTFEASHFAGLATALGFLFMFLCERIPSLLAKIRGRKKQGRSVESGGVETRTIAPSKLYSDDIEMDRILRHTSHDHHPDLMPSQGQSHNHKHHLHHHHQREQQQSHDSAAAATGAASSVSFGLILHSAMDGIPLGAAACSGNQDVQVVLLLATLLHKAPASFGLTSFLLGSGVPRRRVLRSLAYFCLAAPLNALLVAAFLSEWGGSSSSSNNSVAHAASVPLTATTASSPSTISTSTTTSDGTFTSSHSDGAAATGSSLTGLGLLFSAGTMIYTITTHLLPELLKTSSSAHHHHHHHHYRC